MSFSRLAPAALLVLFFGVAAGWRAWHQRLRYGNAGVFLFPRTTRERVGLAALIAVPIVLAAQAALVAFAPQRLEPVRLPLASTPVSSAIGVAIVITSLVLLVWAQLDLGASWRIGIERGARPGLVTNGFYRYARNPIFGFMLVGVAGFGVLVPTWPSVIAFVGSWAAVRLQVAEEEAWLGETYRGEYRAYARRVGRFVPMIGRIRVD